MAVSKRTLKHREAIANAPEILNFYLNNGKDKKLTARKFGVGAAGVLAAFLYVGREDLVPPWYLKACGRTPSEGKVPSPSTSPTSSTSPTPEAIAAELLRQATEAITNYEALQKKYKDADNTLTTLSREKREWQKLLSEAEARAAKATQEADRYRKIHNTIVEESKKEGKPLPTVESILNLLRRRAKPGEPL